MNLHLAIFVFLVFEALLFGGMLTEGWRVALKIALVVPAFCLSLAGAALVLWLFSGLLAGLLS